MMDPRKAHSNVQNEQDLEVQGGRTILRYPYEHFLLDVILLANQLQTAEDTIDAWQPDAIICLARGGLTMASYLAHRMHVKAVAEVDTFLSENIPPRLQQKTPGKKHHYVLVDDISDSGETLIVAKSALEKAFNERNWNYEITTATLWIRETTAFIPDVFARVIHGDTWIDFPWEADLRHSQLGYFIELMGYNRQFYDPPKYLAFRPMNDEAVEAGGAPHIATVPELELASVYEDIAEASTICQELLDSANKYEHPEIAGLGIPMVVSYAYNTDKHAKYWRTFKA